MKRIVINETDVSGEKKKDIQHVSEKKSFDNTYFLKQKNL